MKIYWKADISELKTESQVISYDYLVFCWMNKKTNATLWRSSQTKGGITQQRCVRDEKLLKLIGELGGDRLIIFDARPYLNALANRVLFK